MSRRFDWASILGQNILAETDFNTLSEWRNCGVFLHHSANKSEVNPVRLRGLDAFYCFLHFRQQHKEAGKQHVFISIHFFSLTRNCQNLDVEALQRCAESGHSEMINLVTILKSAEATFVLAENLEVVVSFLRIVEWYLERGATVRGLFAWPLPLIYA